MKILYLGVMLDGTGWARAANDYIMALDSVGVDVVPRPLKLNNVQGKPPDRVLELMKKSAADCTHVIQHVLPHHMEYCGNFRRNIGLYATETSDYLRVPWRERIDTLDEAWVINHQAKEAALRSGVTIPVNVVPHATDISKFQKSYEPLKPLKDMCAGNFIFYSISDINKRKNIPAILRAFHSEFSPNEPVSLVLKCNDGQNNPQALFQRMSEESNKIKSLLKIYTANANYGNEIIMSEFFDEELLMRLHASCDVHISASYGEAWSLPTFDALGFGKGIIAPNHTGFKEYLTEECAWLVDSHETPVFGVTDTFNDLFTSHETWREIHLNGLRKAMREAYENRGLLESKRAAAIDRAYQFSYEVIGKNMLQLLR